MWLYFQRFDWFLFPYFNSNILYSVHLFPIRGSLTGFMVKLHMSDIRMTCEHIRVTYGWHTSDIQMAYEYIRVTYRWHATTYEWHRDDTRLHTSDIQMTYEYMRVTYKLHANDMRVAYEWHANDIRYSKPCKGFGTLRSYFQTYCGINIVLGGCKWFLANRLFRFPYFLLEYSAV